MIPKRILQRNKRAEAYATAASDGTATAVVNIIPGPSWEVRQIALTVTGSTTIPSAATYVGVNSAGVFISSTFIGDSDTDSQPNITLRSGENVCCVWAGCTAGARCKMTLVYDEVGY